MLPISACIMCKNEATKIAAALDSLAWCQDVVVVDSGSTDGTVSIVQNHPTRPRLIHSDWPGYNAQRQFMVAQCRNDWVLMLDADEEISRDLARELQDLRAEDLVTVGQCEMPRRNYIARRFVRCWGPDYQSRLVHKERIAWNPTSSFDLWSAKPPFTTRRLHSAIEHNRLVPYDPHDFNDGHIMEERAAMLAAHMAANGKRAGFCTLLTRPMTTFLKYYVVKGGFLDGRFGLAIAYKTTIGVMLKYSVLYGNEELRKSAGGRTTE